MFNINQPRSKHRTAEMMSDEDSRDSGVCDMEYSSTMSTTFACLNQENIMGMDMDADENSLCEELMKLADEKSERNCLRTFSEITLKVNNKVEEFSRSKNNAFQLFDESPKSRTLFARPSALSFRPANQLTRKRTFAGFQNPVKKFRFDDEPSTSMPEAVPLPISKRRGTGSISLHRVQSSSILERGESYARSHSELPHVLEVNYHLKAISPSCSNAFRRITETTLHEILSSMSDIEFVAKYVLIDCRYPYEYNGGHIRNSVNLYDQNECERFFYHEDGRKKDNRIPIFYCEYSQKRGPSMAYTLRRVDRCRNELSYPHVDYQEMYVLDKGYRNFYCYTKEEGITGMCVPDNYVTMDDQRFTNDLKKWNFHKKSAIGTSVRVVEPRSRHILRQLSADSHFSNTSPSRPSSRRHLFVNKSPSVFGLKAVPEIRTPSPTLTQPLLQPQFS